MSSSTLAIWGGIVLSILGAIGITSKLGYDNVAGIIDSILKIIGFVIAAIGNVNSGVTITKLKRTIVSLRTK